MFKPPHIHTVLYNCKGKPNHVYAWRKDVCYACINGKEVCSEEKGLPILSGLIADAAASVTVVSTAPAASSPAPPPVADEQVQAIPVGTTRAAVVQKLGEPYLKITGETECYTYRLRSGNSAELDFEAGKLRELRVVRSR